MDFARRCHHLTRHISPTRVGSPGKMKVVRNRKGHEVPTRMASSRGSAVQFKQNETKTLTHAEKAKSLLQRTHSGVLATNHFELDHPYASTINLGMDSAGRPFTFISTMAEHTHNLLADPKGSILVSETQGQGDQLANARLTLVGQMVQVPNDDTARV